MVVRKIQAVTENYLWDITCLVKSQAGLAGLLVPKKALFRFSHESLFKCLEG